MQKKLFHQWNLWERDGNSCRFVRRCRKYPVCDYCFEEKIEHQFSDADWKYDSDASCQQSRRCRQCGKQETRVAACDFGKWEYVHNGSCRQYRKCKRCGKVEFRNADHAFGDWYYHSEGSCEQKRDCQHCGISQVRIQHKQVTEEGNCREVTRCTRCGQELSSVAKHRWSSLVRPYEVCLQDAIDHQNAVEKRQNELMAEFAGDPLNPNFARYNMAKWRTIMVAQAYRNQLLNVHPDDLGVNCVICRKPLYLGKADRRRSEVKGFLSYAWSNTDIADVIDTTLRQNGFIIKRDIRNLELGENIQEFMDQLKHSRYVILLITPEYLRRENCMYEGIKAVEALEEGGHTIIPVCCGVELSRRELWQEYIAFWEGKCSAAAETKEADGRAQKYTMIASSMERFLEAMISIKYAEYDLKDNQVVLEQIVGKIRSIL